MSLNKKPISEKYQTNYEYESKVFLPNNLFEKFLDLKNRKLITSSHIPYAFSYLYYQTWLYSYAKYDKYIPTMEEIKEDLGYSKTNKRINYITIKDGLLDQIGLTETTRDFPIGFDLVKIKYGYDKEIYTINDTMSEDWMVEDYFNRRNVNINTTCKKPLFLFHKDIQEHFDGTLNDTDNTTMIEIQIFDFCMAKEDLGVNAFYIYCYLKYKNDKHKEGYDASHKRIANELGLTASTVQKYRDKLRSYNLIELVHNMPKYTPIKEDRKVSTNVINDINYFSEDKLEYTKFHEQNGKKEIDKSRENHMEFLPSGDTNFIWFNMDGAKMEILESQLPF